MKRRIFICVVLAMAFITVNALAGCDSWWSIIHMDEIQNDVTYYSAIFEFFARIFGGF